jgi:O-glycosyl hydrolase
MFCIANALIPNNIFTLKNIISTKVILDNVFTDVSMEVFEASTSTIMKEVHCFVANHHFDPMFLGYFSGYIYWKMNYSQEKMQKLSRFSMRSKNIKCFVFIVLFVLTKNIENAL